MKTPGVIKKTSAFFSQSLQKSKIDTLIKNKEVFLQYNEYRLKRAFEFMPKRTAMVFRVLPFLLHVNHPDFPGYVNSPATPSGIKLFDLSPQASNALTVLFPNAKKTISEKESIMPRHYFIRSLLLMGSIGSIAQTKNSDFDFWVCINEEDFKPSWMKRFTKKLALIEEWAGKEYDVEIHFFPTDIKKARKNIFGESDKESVGSSQAKLLKEEFYRTMILIMGKIPVWWVMPPGVDDGEYARLKKLVPTHKSLGDENFINLGNLYEISYKELFGAALWQMNKAMDSPFKSVLKMGMLEGYIGADETPVLLCTEMKKKVLSREIKKRSIDPYMMMFDHVLNYYTRTGNNYIMDLLCKCFYIKIGIKSNLDMLNKDTLSFKEKAVLHYVKKWGWRQEKLKDLNSYKDWDFQKVLQLGNEVHNFMIKTYQSLADKLKLKTAGDHVITETDRTILGRKLFTFYSEKPKKLKGLRKAFDDGLLQDDLTFYTSLTKSRKLEWSLYRGQLTRTNFEQENMSSRLLINHPDLIYIIIWMVFNKICDLKSRVYLTPNPTDVVLGDIQRLIKELFDFFPGFKISILRNEDLLKKSKTEKLFIVINFYSDRGKWDVESVALLSLTTWGELFYENFQDPEEGMLKACEYIKEFDLMGVANLPEHVRIFAPKGRQYKSLLENAHNIIEKNNKSFSIPTLNK